MNQQDKSFLVTFTVVMSVLVLIAVVIFLAAQMVSLVSVEPDDGSRAEAAAEERIRPVAQVAVADPAAQQAAAVEQSPEQIYGGVCAACHDAGVLEAPKMGSKADWEPRFAQGLDTLVTHAVNGINAMPAKGGNPNLSDDDIRKTIVYMLENSEIQVGETAAEAPEAPADAQARESVTQATAGEASQAEAVTADQAASPSPQSEAVAGSEESVTQAATGEAQEAEAAPPSSESEPAAESVVPAGLDLAQGEETYASVCSVCHAQGVANAPKLGDKDAWGPRIANGWDTLVEHSLKGFNAMPAKGGRVDLADDQIITAVGYMVVESR